MDKQTLYNLVVGDFFWMRLLRLAALIYGTICLYGIFWSDRMIFQPHPSSYRDTDKIIKLKSGPDLQISAIHLPNPAATYTILYSHGNGEDLGDIDPTLRNLQSLGFAVFAYDYRGYGTSQGKPSERNTYADVNAAYNYLTQSLGIPPSQIIAYGRSLGGGPAVDLAGRQPVAGLVVESTFITTFRVRTRIPIVPFDKFDNLGKIKNVRYPVLVIHGTADRTIPFAHGQKLYAAAGEPKRFLQVLGAGHNNLHSLAGEDYDKTMLDFAQLVSQSHPIGVTK
ncbi:MAG: alpha/beta hydrolase [Hormoscilla sp. GM102CHS1]|nr:alpha/beta hydrolase [Hormoscilla sp. GM102CHS1]